MIFRIHIYQYDFLNVANTNKGSSILRPVLKIRDSIKGWPYLTLKKTNIHMTRKKKKTHFPSPIQNNIRVIMTPQSGRSAEAITETRRLLCSRHSGTAVVHHAMISLNDASRRYWVIVLVYSSSSLVSMIKQSEHTYVQTCCLCTQHHAASLVLGLSAGWYKKKKKKKVCNGRRRDGRGTT